MTKVTVITAAYNSAKYILHTVKSVLNQTFTDFEYIIVDDGSTDNTREILKPYMDKIIYIWQENQRQTIARNNAFMKSCGEYIAIIDSDDLWAPDKLEKQVCLMGNNDQIGLVYTGNNLIDEKGIIFKRCKVPDITDNPIKKQLLGNKIALSSFLIRRSAVKRDFLFDEMYPMVGSDWELTLHIACNNYKFGFIDVPLLNYRLHPQNQTSTLDPMVYQNETIELLNSYTSRTDIKKNYGNIINKFYAKNYLMIAYCYYARYGHVKEVDDNLRLAYRNDKGLLHFVLKQKVKHILDKSEFGKIIINAIKGKMN